MSACSYCYTPGHHSTDCPDLKVVKEGLAGLAARENPKYVQAQKDGKAPLEYIPLTFMNELAKQLKHGADKYGRLNWRIDAIKASTYKGSILRHFKSFFEDVQNVDPDSGCHELICIMANCVVLYDAYMQGTVHDDRGVCESKDV